MDKITIMGEVQCDVGCAMEWNEWWGGEIYIFLYHIIVFLCVQKYNDVIHEAIWVIRVREWFREKQIAVVQMLWGGIRNC